MQAGTCALACSQYFVSMCCGYCAYSQYSEVLYCGYFRPRSILGLGTVCILSVLQVFRGPVYCGYSKSTGSISSVGTASTGSCSGFYTAFHTTAYFTHTLGRFFKLDCATIQRCQHRTIRVRKALGETFPTPTFLGPTLFQPWRYRALKIGAGCDTHRRIPRTAAYWEHLRGRLFV